MAIEEPTTFTSKSRGLFRGVALLLVVLVCAALLVGIGIYLLQRQKPKEVLGVQDQHLVGEQGEQRGVARKEKDGDVWRVFATVKLEEPTLSRKYHGWFLNEFTGDVRYAGEFFAVEDGQYSLTYTTEEDVSNFGLFQVSSERREYPAQPTNNIAQWAFEVGGQ